MSRAFIPREYDACAIIAFVDKRGVPSHANIFKTIDALKHMAHRSGDIWDEGDGCGIMTDIPREVWGCRLEEAGLSRHLADSRRFFVGHFLIPHGLRPREEAVKAAVREVLAGHGADLLLELSGATNDAELGPRARSEAPLFWQVAGMLPAGEPAAAGRTLFAASLAVEAAEPGLHVASLSADMAVFKVRGTPDLLPRVYPELTDARTRSAMTLGHSRYSTNTLPTVERAQPFSLLGHNGEINTIERLRSTARTLGIPMVPGGSDSQDLDRILAGLIHQHGFDPLEALCMVFPAVHSEVAHYGADLREVYDFYRWFFPPSAQGPAAVVLRSGDLVMGSVDALGLRPLWFAESAEDYVLSSEKGVVDLKHTVDDPRPLAPGEKLAILGGHGRRAEVFELGSVQKRLVRLLRGRNGARALLPSLYREIPGHLGQAGRPGPQAMLLADYLDDPAACRAFACLTTETMLGAFGWQRYDLDMRKAVAETGKAVIGSMGHQGPLACLQDESLPNISEFFKEMVAVVTNPAIDREREADHFSTRTILGSRPDADGEQTPPPLALELATPLLLGGCLDQEAMDNQVLHGLAKEFGACTLDDVVSFFSAGRRDLTRVAVLDATFTPDAGLEDRLNALCTEAGEAVRSGALLLILDDSRSFRDGRCYIDPALAVARVARCLDESGLRRRCGLVVRSGALRNLHDVMFLLGLGADALNPYLIWRTARGFATDSLPAEKALRNTVRVFQEGMEKVMSTMGIHELCGYGRIFASVGLSLDLAALFGCAGFVCSDRAGLSLARLEHMARRRLERAASDTELPLWPLEKEELRNVRVAKVLRAAATGEIGHREMAKRMAALDAERPVALRHLLGFRKAAKRLDRGAVDISKGGHAMPMVIAAMSFGSQGESSFRTYAEAAKRANIVGMNGEGGEIPDMLGKYRANRGQQVASGRFGVSMDFLNSADFLEIKIGQGAKPGEGGHLPGAKVTAMVAKARHCKPGIALISPSNHHDIYSIEDLHQIITELKTANPRARVSVKIPVTAGVGTIAVGVAKAGADIVNLSGFDGGTGAAREHSKKYVGLPAEIGVAEAHRALEESCLRWQVELWCDGGMRTAADVVKMVLLGADRVGMGTLALMGVGCIACRRCHLDRCPRGISTQLQTRAEAEARGVKGFIPLDREQEVENLTRLIGYVGEEIRTIVAELGQARLADLVGRTDLLEQAVLADRVDVSGLLTRETPRDAACEVVFTRQIARKPLNYLTKLISDLAMERLRAGSATVRYSDEEVGSTDRALGTYLAGAAAREFGPEAGQRALIRLAASVPGNGLFAFGSPVLDVVVDGGAQDGTAKGASGGRLAVLKGVNLDGLRVDGSTGKSFAYGATGGSFVVQHCADSRACIRMSGSDVVFGGRIAAPVRDEDGNLACRAHLKGFAFEYMTGGRAVVLGDPGPWICAGMTGGVVYQCLYPEFGFTADSVRRRLSKYAAVALEPLSEAGRADLAELLGAYVAALRAGNQSAEADAVAALLDDAANRFLMLVPKALPPHQE